MLLCPFYSFISLQCVVSLSSMKWLCPFCVILVWCWLCHATIVTPACFLDTIVGNGVCHYLLLFQGLWTVLIILVFPAKAGMVSGPGGGSCNSKRVSCTSYWPGMLPCTPLFLPRLYIIREHRKSHFSLWLVSDIHYLKQFFSISMTQRFFNSMYIWNVHSRLLFSHKEWNNVIMKKMGVIGN